MHLIKVGQKLDILQMYHKQKNKALQQDQNNKFYQQYQILEILLKLLEVGLTINIKDNISINQYQK